MFGMILSPALFVVSFVFPAIHILKAIDGNGLPWKDGKPAFYGAFIDWVVWIIVYFTIWNALFNPIISFVLGLVGLGDLYLLAQVLVIGALTNIKKPMIRVILSPIYSKIVAKQPQVKLAADWVWESAQKCVFPVTFAGVMLLEKINGFPQALKVKDQIWKVTCDCEHTASGGKSPSNQD